MVPYKDRTILTYNGESHTVKEWANILNIKRNTIYERLKRGCNAETALSNRTYVKGNIICKDCGQLRKHHSLGR